MYRGQTYTKFASVEREENEDEEDVESESWLEELEEIHEESVTKKAESGRYCFFIIWVVGMLTLVVAALLVVIPGFGTDRRGVEVAHEFGEISHGFPEVDNSHTISAPKPPWWQFDTLASLIGLDRQYKLEATILVVLSFCCVWGSTLLSMHVAIFWPQFVPKDFSKKGTLSNVSQDVEQPHGRLFAVALFTSGLLNICGMYTFWLYRAWAPWWNVEANPLGFPTFQSSSERRWRTAWVIIPSVGFMFTAAIPSLSDTSGYKFALMMVHNVLAPLSMAACIIMETVQLQFGENAFSYFFSDLPTPVYGPLTGFQRARVVTVMLAWGCGTVFLGLQTYLGLGSALGMKIKTNHLIGLVSMSCEVGGMVLVGLLPAIAGFGTQFEGKIESGVIDQAMHLIHAG
jgi:hypothetical protein